MLVSLDEGKKASFWETGSVTWWSSENNRRYHRSECQSGVEATTWKATTASNFGKIILQKATPSQAFIRDIFVPKNLWNVLSLSYGCKNEDLAKEKYISRMRQVAGHDATVFDCGLVINPLFSFLGRFSWWKSFWLHCWTFWRSTRNQVSIQIHRWNPIWGIKSFLLCSNWWKNEIEKKQQYVN